MVAKDSQAESVGEDEVQVPAPGPQIDGPDASPDQLRQPGFDRRVGVVRTGHRPVGTVEPPRAPDQQAHFALEPAKQLGVTERLAFTDSLLWREALKISPA